MGPAAEAARFQPGKDRVEKVEMLRMQHQLAGVHPNVRRSKTIPKYVVL